MHLFILKENLSKVLSTASRIVSVHPQLPILANFLFKTENNHLKISATNLELGIIFTIGAKIEKEGEVTIPAKLLTEFIANLNADKIEFLLEGTNLLVKTNKTQASFTTINSADFPSFPSIADKTRKNLPLEKIKQAILRTVFAASTDETRLVLTGVKITISQGKVSLLATDGYRLSMEQVEINELKDELQVILPATSLLELVRIASELKEDMIGFSIIENKNQVVFVLPNVQIFTRLIEGEFPSVEKIIPAGFKTRVVVDRDSFTQSVKTVSLFARGAANLVKIKIEKEGLRLSANTPQVGHDEDFVEAKVEGEETEIAFNYRFLLDLLANFPDKELVFETSGALAPGVFKPLSSPTSFLHLIMPVRVQG